MRSIIETGRRNSSAPEGLRCGFIAFQSRDALSHWSRGPYGHLSVHQAPRAVDDITQRLRRNPLHELLTTLTDSYGLRLGDIALISGVSRPALRKWRDGSARPKRERHRQLCRLGAFCEQMVAAGGAPAEWLDVEFDEPGAQSSQQRVAHLLALGHFDLAWKHFRRESSDSEVLARAFPNRGRGSSYVEWSVDSPASAEAAYVASIEQLGLVASGLTRAETQATLVELVAEYIDDWYEDLRRYSNHQPNAAFVFAADVARQSQGLSGFLFGR